MHFGMLTALAVRIVVGLGTGIALFRILLIQKPDAALFKLNALRMQIGIEPLSRPSIILRNVSLIASFSAGKLLYDGCGIP